MSILEVLLEEERQEQIEFLNRHHLEYEWDIEYAVIIRDHNEIIATASVARNVMKCFLVKEEYKNQGLTNKLFYHLEQHLHEQNIYHYFVFTSPENEKIFTSLNMKRIVKTMNTVLLEGGGDINIELQNLKEQYQISNNKKACVIINANPMTLGHRYLIETAAQENKEVLVFVVSEDLSSFPFEDRFQIIKEATKDLENVKVLPSLSYLVSRLTFPKYFLKEDQLISSEQTLMDVLVYKEYYKKIFHIQRRYLGEEPYSFNTNKYNETLKDYLGDHITIIKRKENNHTAISASTVRKLIKNNHLDKLSEYVPQATIDYLKSDKGQRIIKTIQSKDLGRH